MKFSAQPEGGQLACSLLAHAGYSYSLLQAAHPAATEWEALHTVPGSNATHTFQVPMTNSHRFFRVRRN